MNERTEENVLGLLLVSGVTQDEDDIFRPSKAGMARCKASAEAHRAGRVAKVAIIGGRGRGKGRTFAGIYCDWMQKEYPDVPIAFMDASENCTARDLSARSFLGKAIDASGQVKSKMRVGVVTYFFHALRAIITLWFCGFRHFALIDSREKSGYGVLKELLMTALTLWDPHWRGAIGKKLAKVAEGNVSHELRE